jgi:glycerate kinase
MIPGRALIACEPFGARLHATAAAAAIGAGLAAAGLPEPDVCALEDPAAGDPRAVLDALHFDARMRRARAVIIGTRQLSEDTLLGSVVFEIATRARQGGVPAYAITAANRLDAFDARILDLQVILRARGARGLQDAGSRLAALL